MINTNAGRGAPQKIFFSGIGGISMSAIAAALISKGYKIGGSDIIDGEPLEKLRQMGARIFIGHSAGNVDGYDALVYNARIKEDNPEMMRARELGIPVMKRAQMLGELMKGYAKSIGVTGTHGKSSTTSMISEIFMQAGVDPTFFIGAVYPPVGAAYKIGAGEHFILEADEYSDSFLNFSPDVTVILNIEMDHPDYFKDLDAVINSFKAYLGATGELAIINADDPNSLEAAKGFAVGRAAPGAPHRKILTHSVHAPADIRAKNISYSGGFPAFDIYAHGAFYARAELNVPGDFNIYNALAAASAAYACDISGEAVTRGLGIFKGAARRFDYKGEFNGVRVYEDYSHHPTEIKKMLAAVKQIAPRKIWCVYQPHTYSRTSELRAELCEALTDQADGRTHIILTPIYSATEANTYNICSEDIARDAGVEFISSFADAAAHLKARCGTGDMILLTGAGNINELTGLLL